MKEWLITQGYRMCWGNDRWWSRLWFRYYCPYPVIDDWTAGACIRSGNCGCSNLTETSAESKAPETTGQGN